LKEQASSDKQLLDSMKVQIKELERTHSIENSKLLEKVKELQSGIENHEKEKNAAVVKAMQIQSEQEEMEELESQNKEVSNLDLSFYNCFQITLLI